LTAATPISLEVNGERVEAQVLPRLNLADFLREHLELTGTHVGCEHGVCGACTVRVNGEIVRSCLMLAVQAEGREVRTIEGLASEDGRLHPLQHAFIEHDGLQCGYCTPGQICSAIAMVEELRRGDPSYVTADLAEEPKGATRQEIRERMSGNLCRCGAHSGIVEAIEEMLVGDAV